MEKIIKEDFKVWYGTFIRAVIVSGLFFFGNAITMGVNQTNLKGAFVVAGGYLFLELAKKYGLQNLSSHRELDKYRFLLFP